MYSEVRLVFSTLILSNLKNIKALKYEGYRKRLKKCHVFFLITPYLKIHMETRGSSINDVSVWKGGVNEIVTVVSEQPFDVSTNKHYAVFFV